MARDVDFNVTASDKTAPGIRAAERNFRQANERMKKEQKKTEELLGTGLLKSISKVAPQAAEDLAKIFSKGASVGAPLLAAGVAAIAPFIGATISGAIIGGVAGVGIIGGVALAARDPRVKAAGARLGATLLSGLEQDAGGFIGPVLASIDKIERRFEAMRPKLKSIFDNSAGFLDPLLEGALDGIDAILTGVDRLVSRARPVINAFGDGFASLGRDVGEALDIISGGADGSADAIRTLFVIVGESIVITARFLRGLTEAFGFMVKLQSSIGNVIPQLDFFNSRLDRSADGTRRLGSGTFGASGGLDKVTDSSESAGSALLSLDEKMSQVYDTTRNLFDAQTRAAEAIAGVTKAAKENGRTLDINTEKGRANRQALSNLASALNNSYASYVKVNGEGVKANTVAAKNYTSFIKAATGLGISRKAAEEYARKLGLIPARKATSFHANTHDAEARAKALKAKIDAIRGKTVTINVHAPRLASIENRLDRLSVGGARATGGPVQGGKTYLVGERGPELITMAGPGNVTPNNQLGGGGFSGDLYVQVDLGGAVQQVIKVANRDLKRRATMRGAHA